MDRLIFLLPPLLFIHQLQPGYRKILSGHVGFFKIYCVSLAKFFAACKYVCPKNNK